MLHEITEQEFTEEFLSVIYDDKIKDLNSKFDIILQKINHIKLPESTTKDVINQLNEGLKFIGVDSHETDINKIIQKVRSLKLAKGKAQPNNVEKGITFTNESGKLETGSLENKGDLTINPTINQQKFTKGIYNNITVKEVTSDIIKKFSNDQIIKIVKEKIPSGEISNVAKDKLNNNEISQLAKDKLNNNEISQLAKDKLNNNEIKQLAKDKLNNNEVTQLAKDKLNNNEIIILTQNKLSDDDIVNLAKQKRKLYDKNDYIKPVIRYNCKQVLSKDSYNYYDKIKFIDNGIVYTKNNDSIKIDYNGKEIKRLKGIEIEFVSKNMGYCKTPDNKIVFYDANLNIIKQSLISNSCFNDCTVLGVTNDFCIVLAKIEHQRRSTNYKFILTDINGSTLYQSSDSCDYHESGDQRGTFLRFRNEYNTGQLYLCDATSKDNFIKIDKDTKSWGNHTGSEFPWYDYKIVNDIVYCDYEDRALHSRYVTSRVFKLSSRSYLDSDGNFEDEYKESYRYPHQSIFLNDIQYIIYPTYNRLYMTNYKVDLISKSFLSEYNLDIFVDINNNALLMKDNNSNIYYITFGWGIN